MKKLSYQFGTLIASFALFISVTTANQVCFIFLNQPTLPEGVKSLRNF